MPKHLVDLFEQYALMLTDPVNMDKGAVDFAAELGVGVSTIRRWDRKVDWKAINEKRRESYGRIISTVDSALLRKAQKGDAEAIKLFYARFDGYVPMNATVSLGEKADDELAKRADELMAKLGGAKGASGHMPGTGEARA